MRSGQRWITAGLCCLPLLIGSPLPILAEDRAKSFAQDLAAAKRAGIPTTPQELQLPLPPPDQNAAPLYTELTKILEAKPLSKDEKIIEYSGYRGVLSPEQFERLRRALKSRSDVVSLVHQAVARPKCIFVRNWKVPVDVFVPEYARMRSAARFLIAESLLMTHNGKPLEAVRNQAPGFHIARHATKEHQFIGYLVGNAIDGMTLTGFQKILYLSHGDPKVAEEVRAAVEKGLESHSLRKALEFQAGCDTVTLEYMRRKGPKTMADVYTGKVDASLQMTPRDWSTFIDANSGLLLKNMRRLIAVAETPYPVASRTFRAVQTEYGRDQDRRHLLALTFVPIYLDSDEKRASIQAQEEVTRAGAFALAWKAKHGAFPEKLDGASSPKFVDPFDGKPLRYRREGAGFVVYSVGATGKFTGGAPDQKADKETRFRYPAPAEFTEPLREE